LYHRFLFLDSFCCEIHCTIYQRFVANKDSIFSILGRIHIYIKTNTQEKLHETVHRRSPHRVRSPHRMCYTKQIYICIRIYMYVHVCIDINTREKLHETARRKSPQRMCHIYVYIYIHICIYINTREKGFFREGERDSVPEVPP